MEITNPGIAVVVVALALTPVTLLAFHYIIPKYLLKFLHWMDDVIPADQSGMVDASARTVEYVFGLCVLTAAGLTVASQFGANLSGLLDITREWGIGAGEWALDKALVVVVIVAITLLAIRFINTAIGPIISNYLSHHRTSEESDDELAKRTETLQNVVRSTLTVVVFTMSFFMILSEVGVNITPILAGAGVVGIAIGLGAQSLIKDILAGVFIMLEDQFRVGDVATVAGITGVIESINLRRTTIRDLEYAQHVIPNGEIRVATNLTKEKARVNLDIEVAYKEDLDRVMEVIGEVGQQISDDPEWGERIVSPLQPLRVNSFAASGIAIKVLGETKPMQQWAVAGEFRRRIKRRFDEESIEIPFPHVTFYWGDGAEPPWPTPQNENSKMGGVASNDSTRQQAIRQTEGGLADDDAS